MYKINKLGLDKMVLLDRINKLALDKMVLLVRMVNNKDLVKLIYNKHSNKLIIKLIFQVNLEHQQQIYRMLQ